MGAALQMEGRKDHHSALGRLGRFMLVVALAGLGALSLLSGDFAFQWQPVPKTIPQRELLALVNGAILLIGSLLLAIKATRSVAGTALAAYLALWATLHLATLPRGAPPVVVALGFFEIWCLVGATWLAGFKGEPAVGEVSAGVKAARLGFAVSPLFFGLSHFAYPGVTAKLIPGWIPFPLELAYATGLAHGLGGLAILLGIKPRLAATALGTMYLSWVLVLHLPRVAAAPSSRLEWTMTFIATAISAAAFVTAGSYDRRANPDPAMSPIDFLKVDQPASR